MSDTRSKSKRGLRQATLDHACRHDGPSYQWWRYRLKMTYNEFVKFAELLLEEGVVDHCETTKEARSAFNEALRKHAMILERLEGKQPSIRILRGGGIIGTQPLTGYEEELK